MTENICEQLEKLNIESSETSVLTSEPLKTELVDESQKSREYYEKYKEKVRKYYHDNKERIKEKQKENPDKLKDKYKKYYEQHKEKMIEYQKQYYAEHREKYKVYQQTYQKKYYEKTKPPKQVKEKKPEKIICECGQELKQVSIKYHMLSDKHAQRLKMLSQENEQKTVTISNE